ncbi:uncharacterized protein BDR25DRAFT_301397 [Lindgomyces ingoldianus]|uniref:Uncharacterized protein n=1 Tax=Lindgomyces ingoldianus TaxID=673940 RepID=A0ACB6R8U9_9PLEO|nr:uncharacterized protein BDR25DRAFT_301397 [Lindgomyces ingoldianus]KAF2474755.1 hypothetical protein BDR25DRAFT_301397 [Lindgomyces ingoldianus]
MAAHKAAPPPSRVCAPASGFFGLILFSGVLRYGGGFVGLSYEGLKLSVIRQRR